MAATAAFSSSFVTEVLMVVEVGFDWSNMKAGTDLFENLLTDVLIIGAVTSSLPSNRFDMAPLCQEEPEDPPCLCAESETGGAPAVPAIYMEALPLPGRADGSRLTTTDEERGIICESSLNSE